jgi:hypothetical protein
MSATRPSPLGAKLRDDRVAREVFQAALLADLVRFGASTEAAIARRSLGLFRLPFEDAELRDLLELARRQRLIEPLRDERDAYGERIEATEWAATGRGRKLKPPRGISFGAFRQHVMEAAKVGPTIARVALLATGALTAVPFLAPLLGAPVAGGKSEGASSAGTGLIGAVIVVSIGLAIVFYRGMAGDAKLRRAARAWARLERTWPTFWRWQVDPRPPWAGLVGLLLIVSAVVIRVLGVRHWPGLPYAIGVAILGGLAVANWKFGSEREGPVEEKRAGEEERAGEAGALADAS